MTGFKVSSDELFVERAVGVAFKGWIGIRVHLTFRICSPWSKKM